MKKLIATSIAVVFGFILVSTVSAQVPSVKSIQTPDSIRKECFDLADHAQVYLNASSTKNERSIESVSSTCGRWDRGGQMSIYTEKCRYQIDFGLCAEAITLQTFLAAEVNRGDSDQVLLLWVRKPVKCWIEPKRGCWAVFDVAESKF